MQNRCIPTRRHDETLGRSFRRQLAHVREVGGGGECWARDSQLQWPHLNMSPSAVPEGSKARKEGLPGGQHTCKAAEVGRSLNKVQFAK